MRSEPANDFDDSLEIGEGGDDCGDDESEQLDDDDES